MTSRMSRNALAGAATAVAALGFAAAQAATLAGLQDGKTIVWIDTDKRRSPGRSSSTAAPAWSASTCAPPTASFTGSPRRRHRHRRCQDRQMGEEEPALRSPAEGRDLLGRLQSGRRPHARRLRTGMSLRINVEDGKTTVDGQLKYAEADASKGKQPKVTAAAYSNSFAGTKETALYDIDTANGMLVKQAPPNDGILNTLGKLGMKSTARRLRHLVGRQGRQHRLAMAGGTLYTVGHRQWRQPSSSARSGYQRPHQRHRRAAGDVRAERREAGPPSGLSPARCSLISKVASPERSKRLRRRGALRSSIIRAFWPRRETTAAACAYLLSRGTTATNGDA